MKVTKIDKTLKFEQSDWLKKYINFNTEKRKNAANCFGKDFLKVMINSVYGKTMKNIRKGINVRLVNNENDCLKHFNKPFFFDKHFPTIHEIKPVLTLNKPIYVGFAVLESSKRLLIYDFHCSFTKKKINANLLFADTDSVTYEIKSKDFDENVFKYKHLFDVSEC